METSGVGLLAGAILGMLVLYQILLIVTRRRRFVKVVDALPGPKPHMVFGNVPDLMVAPNKLFEAWDERHRKNATLFRTWIGPYAEINLKEPEQVEAILSSSKHITKSNAYRFLQPWLGTGLLTSTGHKWHTHRKMITPTFHFKILEAFHDVFVEKCEILARKLARVADGKTEFDMYPFITHCTLDIICETAMGVRINAQDSTEKRSDYVSAIYEVSELTLKRAQRPWLFPNFTWALTDMGKRYKHCLSILHGFTNKVIRERKEVREGQRGQQEQHSQEDDLGRKKRTAFLDLLLDAREAGAQLSDEDLREEVDTFMFEGHDTTTAGLCWAVFLLGSHPHIQDTAAEELEHIFQGSDRAPTVRDLQEMKYLERVIKETLRLFPSVPFIGRKLFQDVDFGGYKVPAGCMINIPIYHIHRNPKQWPSPHAFDPDNFLPNRVAERHPYSYVPFSAGPRNCIGQKFALMEEKTVLSYILRYYKIQAVETMEDLTLMIDLILRPESGIKVRLEPRTPLS
ncbi:Cytochrome P450 CYP4 [Frankliniella occidentalis]|uniref:Cytochrome P450 4C1 n=1 Tax=Frankliniella occidentalis TaxID=133901 RepID=A0A6J1SKV4_FRAOC|nr:cytochrome P450 4C1 [Frankliniella occidentalis]KAE8738718.1 Cytochrome P450 CYP4 [Frankliniella occidentalis]